MNQEQAQAICGCLLEAADQLNEARGVIGNLNEAERGSDVVALGELVGRLMSELLTATIKQFPEMFPLGEAPDALRWEDVRLPPDVSEAQIDQIILSVIEPEWQTMATVVGYAIGTSNIELSSIAEIFAARIRALVVIGRLEGQGDLCDWPQSKVRLKF